MGKQIINAVAGSGKTTYLINQLNKSDRFLIITYTKSNYSNLVNKVIDKFGSVPKNIHIFTFYSFIFRECYKPFLYEKLGVQKINFDNSVGKYPKETDISHYSNGVSLYHNRISKLILKEAIPKSKGIKNFLSKKINMFYDKILVDEAQDYHSFDMDFIIFLSEIIDDILLVGDYNQHIYSTSRDGNKHKNLYKNYSNYKSFFESKGFEVDESILKYTYRCPSEICEFISEHLSVPIEPHFLNTKQGKVTLETDHQKVQKILLDKKICKLVYQKTSSYDFECKTWGDSKGDDHHESICIILNKKTYKLFVKNELNRLQPITNNKLYVAISRANCNVYFINVEDIGIKNIRVQPTLFD